jgi:hypothetical protein
VRYAHLSPLFALHSAAHLSLPETPELRHLLLVFI